MESALEGIVVADFTRIFSGPFCTQILGDLGARVIKVERIVLGDESRLFGVRKGGRTPGSPFLAMNRNKQSVALDIKADAGREVARRLAAKADVLVHNFRPGVMERLDLGYEELARINPRLVYCEISGYGFDGPHRTRAANDLQIQAYSGLLSMTGEADRPPVRNPASVSDLTAGMYAAIGILGALVERARSGEGQRVRTSMLGGQLNMVNYFITDYLRQGHIPKRWGTGNELGLPNQVFETADGAVTLTSPNQAAWERTCEALGIGPMALHPHFATLADRYANREELVEMVSKAVSRLTTAEALSRLDAAGVPCAPVNDIPAIAADAQARATGCVVEVDTKTGEHVTLVQTPLELSRTGVRTFTAPPLHGEHTSEVLAQLGYSAEEIAHFKTSGVVTSSDGEEPGRQDAGSGALIS